MGILSTVVLLAPSSLDQLLFILKSIIYLCFNSSKLNEEVEHTKPEWRGVVVYTSLMCFVYSLYLMCKLAVFATGIGLIGMSFKKVLFCNSVQFQT